MTKLTKFYNATKPSYFILWDNTTEALKQIDTLIDIMTKLYTPKGYLRAKPIYQFEYTITSSGKISATMTVTGFPTMNAFKSSGKKGDFVFFDPCYSAHRPYFGIVSKNVLENYNTMIL
jgi:hypothetical protein